MKRFLVVLALVLIAGALLASTALAAAPGPGRTFDMGAWMRSRAGLGQASTPVPGGMTLAPALRSGASAGVGGSAGSMMGGNSSRGMMGDGSMMADLQKLLGVSFQEIHDQMVAGKSLVEIAATKGVTKDQLIQALLDGRKAALDQAVKDGRLTEEQATTMLQYMQKNIETMVNAQGMSGMMGGAGGMMTPPADGGANSGSCPMHGGLSNQPGQIGGSGQPQKESQQA